MSAVFIGTLSGTSMDAIDIAAVDFSKKHPCLLNCAAYPIPSELRGRVRRVQSTACRLDEYAYLDQAFGRLFADSIKDFIRRSGFSRTAITAIGLHGQTILHNTTCPTPLTLQIADPNIVAYQTELTVVADFRRADIAAGGQGAPLAPALHALLFADAGKQQAVVNIGGIANITVLKGMQVIAGFDTGPGNCLMDVWSQKHHKQNYDKDGNWAAAHLYDAKLLDAMLEDAYFSLPPPKSTCTGYFSLDWLDGYIRSNASLSHGVIAATLAELTAATITKALKDYLSRGSTLWVCGGGVYNEHLMECLRRHTGMTVLSTGQKGIAADWVEAMLFAWLAKQRLEHSSGVVAAATGAHTAAVLGTVYHTRPKVRENS